MNNRVKYIDINNRKYYFFCDIIYIKKINSNNIKLEAKS